MQATMKQPIKLQMAEGFAAALLAAFIFTAGACSPVPLGASDANYAKAKQVSELGAKVFGEKCASCHGDRGAGTSAGSAVMGAGALPKFPRDASDSSQRFTDPQAIQTQVQALPPGTPSREPFESAKDVFDYVSTHMPPGGDSRLTEAEYWSVVTFILLGHGAPVPGEGLNAANAGQVSVAP